MNMSQIAIAAAVCIQARVWCNIIGYPGIGKSKLHEAIARALKMEYEGFVFIGSIHEPQDIAGHPYADDKTMSTRMLSPNWVRRVLELTAAGRRVLMFLDELSTNAPAMQAAMLRVVNEGYCAEQKLPDSLYFMLAMNPPEVAAGGHQLTPPMANRLVHLHGKIDARAWCDGMMSNWPTPEIPILPADWKLKHMLDQKSKVIAYIDHNPTALMLDRESFGNEEKTAGAYPTPRTWDMAIQVLAAANACGVSAEIRNELLMGCVGEPTAIGFLSWERELDLPDPEAVLAKPRDVMKLGAKALTRGDRTYAMLMSIVSVALANNTDARWSNALLAVSLVAQKKPDTAIRAMRTLCEAPNRPPGWDKRTDLVPKEAQVFQDIFAQAGLSKFGTGNG